LKAIYGFVPKELLFSKLGCADVRHLLTVIMWGVL